jgi:putative nucleotidyltransferase with HDIG domain
MSSPDTGDGYLYTAPSQLCIGMFVHLELGWTEHPFPFSSFKIKSPEQIATIQTLGLRRIRYSPARSDAEPLAPPAIDPAAPEPAPPPPDSGAQRAKRERIERLVAHRSRIDACEKEVLSKARIVKSLTQNLFAQPQQVRKDATVLVDDMARSLLVDADIAIHLMADKIGKEEVYVHGLNVTMLSMMLAKELKAPPEAMRALGLGALFHDIGKIDMPDRIVRKTEPWTKAELGLLQQHCAKGLEVARKLELPVEALPVLTQHHEMLDGSGYPKGLKGDQISLLARIVAVVNRYDNLCNPNDLAKALTPHEALSTMFGQQRAQFDNNALMTFVRCMGIYPPGTIVVLNNGAIGMVSSVNSTRPLKPCVLIHDPSLKREEAIIVDLEHETDVTIARTLRPQQLADDVHAYLSPRRRITHYFDSQPQP